MVSSSIRHLDVGDLTYLTVYYVSVWIWLPQCMVTVIISEHYGLMGCHTGRPYHGTDDSWILTFTPGGGGGGAKTECERLGKILFVLFKVNDLDINSAIKSVYVCQSMFVCLCVCMREILLLIQIRLIYLSPPIPATVTVNFIVIRAIFTDIVFSNENVLEPLQ